MSDYFQLDNNILYLNHAAVSPWPVRTAEAIERFCRENASQGAANYPDWLVNESRLRAQFAALIGLKSTRGIALLKNTSEALSVVGHGLNFRGNANIVSTNQEFPSNRIIWESLAPRGVALRQADISGPDPEAAIFEQVDANTRLLAVSSVQYASGLRLDLERIGKFCRDNDVLFLVDAIQSLGAARFDNTRVQADFIMADGHKWMMGPEGIALFYCNPDRIDQLELHQFGWHMVEHSGDFDRKDWQPASDARRFECGSPNMLGIHGLSASLSVIDEVGIDEIEQRIEEKLRYLIENIDADRYAILSPVVPERRLGILTLAPRDGSTNTLFESLRRSGVVCAQRGGGVRFSPHFYTSPATLDGLLERLSTP